MNTPTIIFRSTVGDRSPSSDSFQNLATSELESFLQQCRESLSLLGAELEERRVASGSNLPDGVKQCSSKIEKSATDLKILGRLDIKDSRPISVAVDTLKTAQTIRASKIYQLFLTDIIRNCNRGLALLCAASVGKQRIVALNAKERTILVRHIKINMASLDSPILDPLAANYGLPVEAARMPNSAAEQPQKRKLEAEGMTACPDRRLTPHRTTHNGEIGQQSVAVSQERRELGLRLGAGNSPQERPQTAVLDLKLEDLDSFLQVYQKKYPHLQMVCPFYGVPLPFIDIHFESPELSGRLEFSRQLGTMFIQYVMGRKAENLHPEEFR